MHTLRMCFLQIIFWSYEIATMLLCEKWQIASLSCYIVIWAWQIFRSTLSTQYMYSVKVSKESTVRKICVLACSVRSVSSLSQIGSHRISMVLATSYGRYQNSYERATSSNFELQKTFLIMTRRSYCWNYTPAIEAIDKERKRSVPFLLQILI